MYQGGSISLQLVQNSYPTTWLEYRGLLNADHYIIYCFLRTRFPCGCRSLIGKDIELDAIGFQFESYLTASCICTAAPFKLWCGLEFGWWSNCMQTPEILEDKLFLKQIHALQSVGTMYLWLEPPLAKIKTYSGFWMTLYVIDAAGMVVLLAVLLHPGWWIQFMDFFSQPDLSLNILHLQIKLPSQIL